MAALTPAQAAGEELAPCECCGEMPTYKHYTARGDIHLFECKCGLARRDNRGKTAAFSFRNRIAFRKSDSCKCRTGKERWQ